MKNCFYVLLLLMALLGSFTLCVHAEDCNELMDEWFGQNVQLFSSNKTYPDKVNMVIDKYFNIRKTSLYDQSNILKCDFINNDVLSIENKRRLNIIDMQEKMGITIINAANHLEISDLTETENGYKVSVYEWIFYDYDDLVTNVYTVNVSGFGVEHELSIDSNFVIISDLYDERDLTGIFTTENSVEIIQDIPLMSLENKISLMSMYDNYNPDAVAAYADKYALNYNPEYYNFNSLGGDCANYTSQCIYAGGMPQVVGTAYSTDGWYYKTSTNRSATWTGASQLRTWMAKNRGNLIDNPNASQIYKGSPVFYDWDKNGTWDHATICVGKNSEGTPIINSHNADKYHIPWNYGSNNTKCSTVQLTSSPSTPTPITIYTNNASNIQTNMVTVSGSYHNPESKTIKAAGIYYGKDVNSMKRYAVDRNENYVNGGIFYDIVSLSPGTTYYYQLFVNDGSTDFKGEIRSFKTVANATNIEVTTGNYDIINSTTVQVKGSYYNSESVTVKRYGFYYGTDKNNMICAYLDRNENYVSGGMYYDFINLIPGQTYYYQAFVSDGKIEQRGEMCSFSIIRSILNFQTVEYDNHLYVLFEDAVSWADAKQECEKLGGHLATVTSDEEYNVILSLLRSKEANVWLGATDEQNEGTWTWITGEKFEFENWDVSQPDNTNNNEHYLSQLNKDYNYEW